MQSIFSYWYILMWKTELNTVMVKYLTNKCYNNGAVVTTSLGGGEHGMLRDLMSTALHAKVYVTSFSAPTEPFITTPPPPPNRSPLPTRFLRMRTQRKFESLPQLPTLQRSAERSFRLSYQPHILTRYPKPSSSSASQTSMD